jgi:hypothetical protein
MVLVGGAGGRFRSVEILSRVAQQFGPLHPLVYVGLARRREAWRPLVLPAATLVILHQYRPVQALADESLRINPQRVNQHFRSSLREREEISRVVGTERTVLVDSRTPNLTALANVVSLFSNLRLAIPPDYLKFFLLEREPLPPGYRWTDYILILKYLPDIQAGEGPGTVYEGRWFRVRKNDRILLFDNGTFPTRHGMDVERLRAVQQVQARELDGQTAVTVCSERAGTIRLRIGYTHLLHGERVFEVRALRSATGGQVRFGSGGTVETPALGLERGENRLEFRPVGTSSEKIQVVEMSVLEE